MIRSIAVILCAMAVGGCASSASLAREGNYPAACREALDERAADQQVLRERLFAEVAPKLAIEMVDAPTTSKLRELVGNRDEAPRFARIAVELDQRLGFEAELFLESVQDRRAYYRVGYIDELVAANLVYSRPEGDLADLAAFAKFAFKAMVNLTLVSLCASADAAPGCMGFWMDSELEEMRGVLASVDADPELRQRKQQLLDAAAQGDPLVVLLPNPSNPLDRPAVQLRLKLRSRFDPSSAPCSHNQLIIVELPGQDIDEAVARDLSRRPRPLESLRPTLEWDTPDEPGQD